MSSPVQQRWSWPAGSVSPKLARNVVLVLLFGLILFLAFCGGSNAPVKPGSRGVAQPGDPEEARRYSAELELRQLARKGSTAPAVASANPRHDGQQQTVVSGDPAPPPQLTPWEQAKLEADIQLYKKQRERATMSPLAFSAPPPATPVSAESAIPAAPEPEAVKTIPVAEAGPVKQPPEEGVPPPSGGKHRIREGTIVEAVLVNRLDSTFSGPVIVQVSNDVYSHDRMTLLIPKGTRMLGVAEAVNALGQSRVAVIFHRMIRPDDVAISLDKFTGLNQIGETGLKDKVNNHYIRIFGVSLALGMIGAVAQGTSRYGFNMDGWDLTRQGFGYGMSRAAEQVLNRFLNIPPTVTIREGHRVKVHFTSDLEVPQYGGKE